MKNNSIAGKAAAYREAAQYASAFFDHLHPDYATIVGREIRDGWRCIRRLRNNRPDDFDLNGLSAEETVSIEKEIVAIIAGVVAEGNIDPVKRHRRHDHKDYKYAVRLAKKATGSHAEIGPFISWLTVRAEDFVGDFWFVITALANELLLKKSIEKPEADQIILQAIRGPRVH